MPFINICFFALVSRIAFGIQSTERPGAVSAAMHSGIDISDIYGTCMRYHNCCLPPDALGVISNGHGLDFSCQYHGFRKRHPHMFRKSENQNNLLKSKIYLVPIFGRRFVVRSPYMGHINKDKTCFYVLYAIMFNVHASSQPEQDYGS